MVFGKALHSNNAALAQLIILKLDYLREFPELEAAKLDH